MHVTALRPVHSTFSKACRANRAARNPLRVVLASSGYTLLELVFALAPSLTLGAVAAPQLPAAVEDIRARGRCGISPQTPTGAHGGIARAADVGWQFVVSDGDTPTPASTATATVFEHATYSGAPIRASVPSNDCPTILQESTSALFPACRRPTRAEPRLERIRSSWARATS